MSLFIIRHTTLMRDHNCKVPFLDELTEPLLVSKLFVLPNQTVLLNV